MLIKTEELQIEVSWYELWENKEIVEFLERYVEESNAIEDIFVRRNHHLFADHMEATKAVLRMAIESDDIEGTDRIHAILMKRELIREGELRKVRVRVGSDLKPLPEMLPKLMVDRNAMLLRDYHFRHIHSVEEKDLLSWHYHYWFEAIHPFLDGNGRTGRLELNNIRLVFGLPWIIIPNFSKEEYYFNILKWEGDHRNLFSVR